MPQEQRDTQGGAAGPQRRCHHRVDAVLADAPDAGPEVRRPSAGVGVINGMPRGQAGGQGPRQERVFGVGFGRTRRDRRLGAACQDGLLCDPAEDDGAGDRIERRLLAVDDGVQQVDADEIGKSAGGDVRQFLGGAGHVQGAADTGTGFVHDGQSTPRPVLFGVVEHRSGNAVHLAVLILQWEKKYGPGVFTSLAGSTAVVFVAHHLPGPQHLFLQLVDLLKNRIGSYFPRV